MSLAIVLIVMGLLSLAAYLAEPTLPVGPLADEPDTNHNNNGDK